MKHDCDIVRDLMPMCIDGTASKKAQAMVDEHVQECPPCDKIYAEMKGETKIELPVQPAAPEFVTTVKKMKSRRKRRTWLTLLTGVLLAALVAFAGFIGYFWYFVDMAPLETANLSVVTTADGIALIRATNLPRSATMRLSASQMNSPESAVGQYEVKVQLYATRFDVRHRGGAEIYFVIGGLEEDMIYIEERGYGNAPVYRMLYGRTDGSGKVFYLSGEEELPTISLKGAHLKTPETANIRGNAPGLMPFVTLTPMPSYTPDPEGVQALIMFNPTPTPTLNPNSFSLHDGPTSAFTTSATEAPAPTSTPQPMASQLP